MGIGGIFKVLTTNAKMTWDDRYRCDRDHVSDLCII